MTAATVVFWLLSALTVSSAFMVVTTPHVVHAALWLVVTLGSVAGCFLVMTAELVAWVQVLVYVGAVVVLLLFALMLTRAPTWRHVGDQPQQAGGARRLRRHVRRPDRRARQRLPGTEARPVRDAGGPVHRRPGGAADRGLPDHRRGDLHPLGAGFELLSVVLLAALIGAIVVSGRVRDRDLPAAEPADHERSVI
jgi:NADH-quinone oxidoreductase subunit J